MAPSKPSERLDTDCSPICRSAVHRDLVVGSVTHAKSTEELTRFMTCICSSRRPFRIKDSTGKSILHLAASTGKQEIVSWYLRHRPAPSGTKESRRQIVDQIDAESGWTALHRSAFSGEMACASILLKHGADASVKDRDGFSPVQLLLYDAGDLMSIINRSYERPEDCFPVAFFAWGTNMNFTLGFGDEQERHIPDKIRTAFPSLNCIQPHSHTQSGTACTNCGNTSLSAVRSIARGEMHLQVPLKDEEAALKTQKHALHTVVPHELAEYRSREKIPLPVIDILLRKFHTIILAPKGVVYVCGHGRGGRLGLGTESPCLHPSRVSFPESARSSIVAIAAGLNHSVFLSQNGNVYSCGSNEYLQLGIQPPPEKILTPTEITPLPSLVQGHLKRQGHLLIEVEYTGIAAERCHTLVWSKSSLYVCGFNGGQLGLRPDRSGKSKPQQASVKEQTITELHHVVLKEVTEVSSFFPARFIRCSDAAVLICGPDFKMIVMHEYGTYKLPKLPVLSRVRPDQFYRLTEICVFGGNLDLPGKEASLKRDLIVVALAFDMPMLYVDKAKGSWIPISLTGVPRDMSSIFHISLSSDVLLMSTSYGECFTIKLSKRETTKNLEGSFVPVWTVSRVPRLWRAVKVFSEPGSRNFAAIQLIPPFVFQPCITSFFDKHWAGASRVFSQESSSKPNVRILVDGMDFGAERLFLLTGSKRLRGHMPAAPPPLTEDRPFFVVDLAGKASLQQLERQLTDAYHLHDWEDIRRQHYGTAKGIWDVEPDMEISCDEEDDAFLNCHRWILTSRVPYFECLFEGNRWKDSDKSRAAVIPCDKRIGINFLEFIYTGGISNPTWNWDDCVNFLKLADFLVHEEMRAEVSKYFMPSMNNDQLWSLYRVAEMYNSIALKNDCVDFMVTMLPDLLESRQLECLDQASVDRLTMAYQESFDFSSRIIAPYEMPEVDLDLVLTVKPAVFPMDDEVEPLSDSASSKSSAKKFSKRVIAEPVPSSPPVIQESPKALFRASSQIAKEKTPEPSSSGSNSWQKVSPATERLSIAASKNQAVAVPAVPLPNKPFGLDESKPSTTKQDPVEPAAPKRPVLMSMCSEDESSEVLALSHSPPVVKVNPVLSGLGSASNSLTAIMEEQKRQSQLGVGKAAPAQKGPKPPRRGKFVPLVDVPETAPVPVPPQAETPSRPKGNPWQKIEAGPKSLDNIMKDEIVGVPALGKSPSAQPNSAGSSSSGSKSGPDKRKFPGSSPSWNVPKSDSVSPGSSSQQRRRDVPMPLSSPVENFQKILQDEIEQQAQLQKTRSRPMHFIQIEERAVEQLLEFYGADANPEEFITVERVLPKQAQASWSARAAQ